MALTRILGLIILAFTVDCAAAPPASPYYPPFGLDLSAFDHATKPGDDFFQFANGGYLARTVIPPDQPMASRRSEISDRIDANLKLILEDSARNVALTPADLRGKVGAFYAAFMDEDLIGRD